MKNKICGTVLLLLITLGFNMSIVKADGALPNCKYDSLQACYDARINSNTPSAQQTEEKNYCERTCNEDGVIVSTPVLQGDYVKCGDSGAFPSMLPKLTRILFSILQIFTPIILIILGMVDFLKATSADAENIDKSKKKFVNRLISGCAVFFVLTIVRFVVSNFATDSNKALECVSCFINNSNKCQATQYTALDNSESK